MDATSVVLRRSCAGVFVLLAFVTAAFHPARALDVLSAPRVGTTTHAASTSSLVEDDEVSVGSVEVSLDDNLFHVGDERTIYVHAIVSFGDIKATQKGYFSAHLKIDGEDYVLAVETVAGGAAQDGRIEFYMNAMVQGCEVGTATIEAKISVGGWENGLIFDDLVLNQTGSATTAETVQYPLLGPLLNPGSQTFNHPGSADHTDLLYNYSAETVFVEDAWVNHAKNRLTSVAPGNDPFGTPTLGALVTGKVAHEAGPHPGTTVAVPFTWGITLAEIFVLGGTWQRTFSPNATDDSCTDPGNPGSGSVPPSESSDESRRPSSGERHLNRQMVSRRPSIPEPAGVVVRLSDTVDGVSYDCSADPGGNINWSGLMLGPTVGVELNAGGTHPGYRSTAFTDLHLSKLESPEGVPRALTLLETVAGPITGWVGADDGGPISVELLTRPSPADPPELLRMVPGGAFELRGFGWFDLEGPASEILLVGHPGANRTLASPETLVAPLPAPAESVDVGAFAWHVLPHSPSLLITFRGRFLERGTGLPIVGLQIETATDPGGDIDGTTATAPDGRFELVVPNGPHTVWALAADLGYVDPGPQAVDFGSNGYEILDVGDRFLAPLDVTAAPDGGRYDTWLQVAPNPAAAGTTIRFSLPRACDLSVTIHDPSGRLVLVREGHFPAGASRFDWDGADREGRPVPAGLYFVRVAGNELHATAKLMLLRR